MAHGNVEMDGLSAFHAGSHFAWTSDGISDQNLIQYALLLDMGEMMRCRDEEVSR